MTVGIVPVNSGLSGLSLILHMVVVECLVYLQRLPGKGRLILRGGIFSCD